LGNKKTIIVGAGHAGIEAAFALSRSGIKSTIITLDRGAIGRLSCNPAIGGLAKSHLVKEIDALGGIMGHAADASAIQFKTLNKTKGRAVWSLRAQVDKKKYPLYIKSLIRNNSHISILEDEAVGIVVKKNKISGIKLKSGKTISCRSAIITCGTFLNGLIHIGLNSFRAGRLGEQGSCGLTESLVDHGFISGRLKTGTPPRISKKSIDISSCVEAPGDSPSASFSIFSKESNIKNEPCFLVNTNLKTQEIIFKNLKKSAMFSGKISGVGPRYCPSIEDKFFRFKERSSHHLFLEPEWSGSNQIYVNGFSTSLPEKVQLEALRSIKPLKEAVLIRPGYAIEYDYLPPRQLKASLETKEVAGLFLAGQMNGTSGYEEAAAQGLVAGINSALFIRKEKPFIFSRSSSYIGVMVDDLITSHLDEPYRMFTSRAEHRLYLRPDNAYSRLSREALKRKIITPSQRKIFREYFTTLNVSVGLTETRVKHQNQTASIKKLLKRPEFSFKNFQKETSALTGKFLNQCLFEVETNIKYEGYIQNELERIDKNSRLEFLKIPPSFVYTNISGLSNESVERLSRVMPETLGQASRISGVRPTDITLLGAHIKNLCVSRET